MEILKDANGLFAVIKPLFIGFSLRIWNADHQKVFESEYRTIGGAMVKLNQLSDSWKEKE